MSSPHDSADPGPEADEQFIYVGWPCPVCDGQAGCPVCDGAGEIGELVTFAAFRVIASLASPPRALLV